MAVHDSYARLTPYELLLPGPDFADERFPAIEAEAGTRGTDLHNPAAFAMSGAVQGILAELRPDGDGPDRPRQRKSRRTKPRPTKPRPRRRPKAHAFTARSCSSPITCGERLARTVPLP